MASSRRRGAHAEARLSFAPPAGVKRAPQPAAAGRAPEHGGAGGKRVSGLRSRPPLLRVIAAALVVVFGAVGFAGGLWSSPSAEPTVQTFLLDWQQHSYAAAAALTTGDPTSVAAALRDAYTGLDAAAFYLTMGPISQHGGTAQASFHASVDLGQNGAPWNYQGRFSLRRAGSAWKIIWSPGVINPGLRTGLHLAMISSTPRRKPLLDAAGQPLQTPSVAYVAGVRPGRLTQPAATAKALGRATRLDPVELLGWILTAPKDSFQELVVLRPSQYRRMAHRLAKVPGLIVRQERLRLFDSIAPAVVGSVGTEASAALRDQGIAYRPGATVGLSGLQQADQRKLAGSPTTKVIAENAAGREVAVLATWNGSPPTAVRTTLDSAVQTAAMNSLATAQGSAALVAVQASTGHILAVADHSVHGMPKVEALAGHYPPGGVFTFISSQALLASGLGVGNQIRCTALNDVGGRNFRNVPAEPSLGAQPTFAVDFAHDCVTALAGLSRRLTAHGLAAAAAGFGLGAKWGLPLPSFAGKLWPAVNVAQLASQTVGEGGVQVSPLAMALAAAQVDSGTWHAPTLVTGTGDAPAARKAPFGPATLASLRALLRGSVSSGAAAAANLPGQPVYGQVGTVRLATGKHHRWGSWFVGYRGDVAFAVLEVSSSVATSAAKLAAAFLAASPSG
jgi:transpeptidase family protein/MecA-like transpeptidase family protein/penicillin-binding protein